MVSFLRLLIATNFYAAPAQQGQFADPLNNMDSAAWAFSAAVRCLPTKASESISGADGLAA